MISYQLDSHFFLTIHVRQVVTLKCLTLALNVFQLRTLLIKHLDSSINTFITLLITPQSQGLRTVILKLAGHFQTRSPDDVQQPSNKAQRYMILTSL